MRRNYLFATAMIGAVLIGFSVNPDAQGKRVFARGAKGAAGGYASSGQYGSRAGVRALGQNAGFGARAGSYAGPNGGALQTGGAAGYKRGVGAFRAGKFNASGPQGGTASGYHKNVYDAQSGTGTRASGAQIAHPSGQQYGYDGTTSYAKGQGATTTLDTQNKGDYTIDWQKGHKPVVTPVEAPQ